MFIQCVFVHVCYLPVTVRNNKQLFCYWLSYTPPGVCGSYEYRFKTSQRQSNKYALHKPVNSFYTTNQKKILWNEQIHGVWAQHGKRIGIHKINHSFYIWSCSGYWPTLILSALPHELLSDSSDFLRTGLTPKGSCMHAVIRNNSPKFTSLREVLKATCTQLQVKGIQLNEEFFQAAGYGVLHLCKPSISSLHSYSLHRWEPGTPPLRRST